MHLSGMWGLRGVSEPDHSVATSRSRGVSGAEMATYDAISDGKSAKVSRGRPVTIKCRVFFASDETLMILALHKGIMVIYIHTGKMLKRLT